MTIPLKGALINPEAYACEKGNEHVIGEGQLEMFRGSDADARVTLPQ